MHAYHLSQWLIFFFIYSFIGWIPVADLLLYLQLHRLGLGELLCVCAEAALGEPGVPSRTDAADLRIRSGGDPGEHHRRAGASVADLYLRPGSTIGVREHPWLIFIFGLVAATALEYVTGAVMERMFHVRYWDYSNQKLNVHGYICASSSLCWGVFSVLLVRFVHVPIERVVLGIPLLASDIVAMVLTVAASVDLTQSFNEAMDFKRVLAQLEESKEQIRRLQERVLAASEEKLEEYRQRSDELVGEYRQRVDELVAEYKKRSEQLAEEHRKRTEELAQNYRHIASQLRRNPTASSKKFAEAFKELKDTIENRQ